MPWVFRGHAELEWQLLPSAWRSDNPLMIAARREAERRFDAIQPQQRLIWSWPPTNFQSGAATFGANDPALQKSLTIDTTAELLLAWDFALGRNELGLATPLWSLPPDRASDPNWLWFAQLPLMADEFSNFADLPAALALTQHHGVPTRLLDWTHDPVAAAFFAIERIVKPVAGKSIVVWALQRQRAPSVRIPGVLFPNGPQGAPAIDVGLQIVRPPVRDNPYLAAQSGLFTTIAGSGIYFMQSGGNRISVDEIVVASKPAAPVLRKVVLPHESVADLARILDREKMSRSALLPTTDNVAADVRRRWTGLAS
jgi:hypothetical protein